MFFRSLPDGSDPGAGSVRSPTKQEAHPAFPLRTCLTSFIHSLTRSINPIARSLHERHYFKCWGHGLEKGDKAGGLLCLSVCVCMLRGR